MIELIRRAVVSAVQASRKLQVVQARQGDDATAPVDEGEHFEPFGWTARPLAGAEALLTWVLGPEHPIVLAVVDRRHRPTDLGPGEAVAYNAHGKQVRLEDDRVVVKSGDVRLGSNNAAHRVAREGDSVSVTIPAGTVVVAIVHTIVGGVVTAVVATMNPAPITLTGTITAGSNVTRSD